MSNDAGCDVAVCLKPVPDPQSAVEPAADGQWVVEGEPSPVTSEADEAALEEALRLHERTGGSVTAITVADARGEPLLRRALSLGVDRAILVHTEEPARDPHVVAELLCRAIERCGPFDLILTGAQSQDLASTLTGTLLAARLDWAHSWLAIEIREVGADSVVVARELEAGARQVDRLSRPAVLQVQSGINQPRMAKIRDVIAAKKRTIETVAAAELGEAPRPRVRILGLETPQSGSCFLLEGSADEAAARLLSALRGDGLLGDRAGAEA